MSVSQAGRLKGRELIRRERKKRGWGRDEKTAILCPAETLKSWRYGGCLKVVFFLEGIESIVIVLSFSKLISWAFLKGTFYGRNQKLLMFSFLLFPVPLCHFLFPVDLCNFTLFASIFPGFRPSPHFILPFFFLSEKNEQGTESRGSYACLSVCSHIWMEKHLSSSCRFLSLCPRLYQTVLLFPPSGTLSIHE